MRENTLTSEQDNAVVRDGLLSARGLIGKDVLTLQGSKLGVIHDLMVEPSGGSVAFVVLNFYRDEEMKDVRPFTISYTDVWYDIETETVRTRVSRAALSHTMRHGARQRRQRAIHPSKQ